MLKPIAALAALALSASAFAQTTPITPAAQQVQLLAPQLVAFSGSTGNFDSVVNGLTSGAPVTLTTLTPDGLIQVVTFLPGTTITAADAARQLEAARQNLIARGVATPTAQQLAVSLVGGPLTTLSGTAPLTGVLTGNTGGTTPIQVRSELAPVSTLAGAGALNLSTANLQALRTALGQGSAATLSSTTPAGVTQSVTFTAPGGPMNAFEVNQALQLAAALLAQLGVLNPTPEQIRVALVGGTLGGVNGTNVAVQGVLQGRVRATSESPLLSTSNSPFIGTSNTPSTSAPVPNAAPVAAPVDGVRRPNTAEGANRAPTVPRPGG